MPLQHLITYDANKHSVSIHFSWSSNYFWRKFKSFNRLCHFP